MRNPWQPVDSEDADYAEEKGETNSVLDSECSLSAETNLEADWWTERLAPEKEIAGAQGIEESMKDELNDARTAQEGQAPAKSDPAVQQKGDTLQESPRSQGQSAEEAHQEAQK